jgi:uncharacterized Zn finger protein
MDDWGWRPYESVEDRKLRAEKTIAKMEKKGLKLCPIRIEGRQIVTSFWGKAWCSHLESFSDYATRLPRGRSYARHGSVINLVASKGKVEALVQGSELYNVSIHITKVDNEKWQAILKKCSGEIASIIELLQGKLSSAVMATITDKQNGLFPLPKEISLKCSCPDWAGMCKHIAAALYGVGTRLDLEPELLFTLRNVDHMELLQSATISTKTIGSAKSKTLEDQDLSALFGIDFDAMAPEIEEITRTNSKTIIAKDINKKRKTIKIKNQL